jgi:hypothetical protein
METMRAIDGAQSTNLILPVSNSCIMPCLSWRVLVSFSSRTAIAVSISERIVAMRSRSSSSSGKGISSLRRTIMPTEERVEPLIILENCSVIASDCNA